MQGVGFRPFVYRLAGNYNLKGKVRNAPGGVVIVCSSEDEIIRKFSNDMLHLAPAASFIKSLFVREIPVNGFADFSIDESDIAGSGITEISPDIAVCDACIEDMHQQPERIGYPFINCTNCGPRFSIVTDLPYDRASTTMNSFVMCPSCTREYKDISDRRFHAQPVACNFCGPVCHYRSESGEVTGINNIIGRISFDIAEGRLLTIKGMGGYHLVCDALNEAAVRELRRRKHRDNKPFAVLFRHLDAVKEYCFMNAAEEEILSSWRRPIVILRQRKELAPAVNVGLNTIGAMLPYMPLHYLVFEKTAAPAIVFTSGNICGNPIITDDQEAEQKLWPISDAFVSYDRQIFNRTDDSVVRLAGEKVNLIRRSRGYVPSPVDLDCNVDGILALGAEQKNSFCIGKGNQAIPSQYIGDLKGWETYSFYTETIGRFSKLYRFQPGMLVCDLHPDYLSTQYAHQISAESGIPLIKVQHHHAHIASCMAENQLDEKVIGVCFDGAGYGTDGNTWGGEILIAGRGGFRRYAHFSYVPMPGGDKVIAEPWRMALAYLHKCHSDYNYLRHLPAFKNIDASQLEWVAQMLEKEINTPLTSSVGRLFDAVAALTGICTHSTFDSEAAMRLESLVVGGVEDHYPFETGETISCDAMMNAIARDLTHKDLAVISTRFHNTLARIIADVALSIRNETGINKVVLSGGVFQNCYLLQRALLLLKGLRFFTYTQQLVPANDGGISLGQLIVASNKYKICA